MALAGEVSDRSLGFRGKAGPPRPPVFAYDILNGLPLTKNLPVLGVQLGDLVRNVEQIGQAEADELLWATATEELSVGLVDPQKPQVESLK